MKQPLVLETTPSNVLWGWPLHALFMVCQRSESRVMTFLSSRINFTGNAYECKYAGYYTNCNLPLLLRHSVVGVDSIRSFLISFLAKYFHEGSFLAWLFNCHPLRLSTSFWIRFSAASSNSTYRIKPRPNWWCYPDSSCQNQTYHI